MDNGASLLLLSSAGFAAAPGDIDLGGKIYEAINTGARSVSCGDCERGIEIVSTGIDKNDVPLVLVIQDGKVLFAERDHAKLSDRSKQSLMRTLKTLGYAVVEVDDGKKKN